MSTLVNSIMWGFGILLVLAVFLAATGQIEAWLKSQDEEDDDRI